MFEVEAVPYSCIPWVQIAKTHAKQSAYQILSVIVLFVV
jgi:hypothetical protein